MKGLLLKDLYNLRGQSKILIIFIVLYIFMGVVVDDPSFFVGMLTIVVMILPITALAYDEKAKWDRYALTMPISRKMMVVEKYVLGGIMGLSAFIINLIVLFISQSSTGGLPLAVSLAVFAVGAIFLSLLMPFIYKFGVEKSRIIMIIIAFIPFCIIMVADRLGGKITVSEDAVNVILFAALPLAVVFILIISLICSMKIYGKKEF